MSYTSTGGLQDAASVALKVAGDPALPTVVSLVSEIKALSSKGGSSSSSSSSSGPGIGLSKIVTPLRAFVAYKKRPWIAPALIGGVVVGIFALGVISGRARQRRKAP